jgi:thiamine-phosphate pyrophosphorylase
VRNLADCYLYGILDLSYVDRSRLSHMADAMITGGVDLIQLRGKNESIEELTSLAESVHRLTAQASIPFVVNDYPEIAQRVSVEGVHVGQDDDSVATVRRKVGRRAVVGKSTHSVYQALSAKGEGADYIGFGPLFATPTKPEYQPIGVKDIKRVHEEVALPIFCIGGIKLDNLEQVIVAGARRVVIVSGLLQAPDIAQYAGAAKQMLASQSNRNPQSAA